MENFKELKIIILPAKKEDNSGYVIAKCIADDLAYRKRGDMVYGIGLATKCFKKYNLYLISDEYIKEEDWCLHQIQHEYYLKQAHEDNALLHYKIVATTDSLNAFEEYPYYPLPKVPESFIKEYVRECNAGNKITDVLVEYELFTTDNSFKQFPRIQERLKARENIINIKLKK